MIQLNPFLKVFCQAFLQKSDRFSFINRNLISNIKAHCIGELIFAMAF